MGGFVLFFCCGFLVILYLDLFPKKIFMLIQTTSVKLSETYTQIDQSWKGGSLGIGGDKRIVSGLCIAKILELAGLANTASLLLSSILSSIK